MDLRLNDAVMNVELSGIRRFTFLVRDTPGACALTIGEPDLNTPDPIKEAAKAALDANDTSIRPETASPTCWRPSPSLRRSATACTTAPTRSW